MSSARSVPPYLRIVAQLRSRILAGELRPGERMPSVRQIAQRWGVALATATKVMAVLRDEGLVETRVGAGAVVGARAARARPGAAPRVASRRALDPPRILRAAIAIADREGLEAVSMRRLGTELGVGPMSLYRHVANRDELVARMIDTAFGEVDLPDQGPPGWRAKLELVSRRQWELCRRHLWLARAVSFTRPLPVPCMTAHTEWTLRALDGLGLPVETRMREALTLPGLVVTVALSLAEEVEAEQETGLTHDRWRLTRDERAGGSFDAERFPLLATVPGETVADLNGLFEYGLARHLDGFAVLVERHTG